MLAGLPTRARLIGRYQVKNTPLTAPGSRQGCPFAHKRDHVRSAIIDSAVVALASPFQNRKILGVPHRFILEIGERDLRTSTDPTNFSHESTHVPDVPPFVRPDH